jgi:uncharacterized membrane protein
MALILLGAVVLGLTILAGESLSLPPLVARPLALIRLALGLAYVLFAPGYCLTAALFPRASDLDGAERAGLSLGLSAAWLPGLALLLDRLPESFSLEPLLAGLLASIAAFAAAAVWRRERLPPGAAFAPKMAWRPGPQWRALPPLDRRVLLGAAGALLVSGLAAAWVFAVPSPGEFMTEFYVLGRGGLAEDYPLETAVGEELSVTLGIANQERVAMSYRVEVWAMDLWNERRELVNTAGPFTLSPGETMQQAITWQMPWPGDDLAVEFYLFAGEAGATPYRSLRLWLDVTE